jgi:ubiquinone/menaquinone biosynthesis C-methylase UbiE
MSYNSFADCYDGLQASVDYKGFTEYLISLFKKYDKMPTLLLDVGCGTGQIALLFKKSGVDVIGVDQSAEMLAVASTNAAKQDTKLLLLNQSASELDLYGTVDGAVCCLDTVNHIIDKKELQKSFDKISLFLERDRLFIFDVNTLYKHKEVLSGNVFVYDTEDVYCVWKNSKCDKNGVVDICLDFFTETENGTYTRYLEEFSERAYSVDVLKDMLDKAGFNTVAVLGEKTKKPPKSTEERIFFVARKR